jgi:hypothetical protein
MKMGWKVVAVAIGSMVVCVGSLLPLAAAENGTLQLARGGEVFEIFQFPRDQMPRIDGKTEDWDMVPDRYSYGTDLLNDTEDGHGTDIDPKDLDVKVTVGWVKGLNRLYVLYEAYDDFWDFGRFNPKSYLNDIFEIAVDGDLSGGPFIFNPVYRDGQLRWGSKTAAYLENHFEFSGVHAQNYHFYTPPVNNAWVLVWGSQHWVSEFPQSNYAYDYDFKPGESGKLVMELWLTPYDYAPHDGPEKARETPLVENKTIGLSWSILDFDGGKRDGHVNLAHNVQMVKDASYLCAFKLNPIEKALLDPIRAEWSFKVIDMERGLVAFQDESIGEIDRWHWDFGGDKHSDEQHPIFRFEEKGVHKVVTLEVTGAEGSSKRTRYWEVMIR